MMRIQSDILDRLDARFRPMVAREIARTMRRMIAEWEDTGVIPDPPEHEREVGEILRRVAEASIRAFAALVMSDPKAAHLRLEQKDFAGTVAKLALRYIALEGFRRKITQISDTTRANIITAIDRGFDAGLGQEGVARFVSNAVPEIARARSRVIARTETHGAANYGAFGAAKETGLVLQKEWLAAEDHRTRPDHAEMNGVRVDMDALFDFGAYSLAYPGDPSGPAEGIINCRCSVAYVVQD
jgi:hypothetical protein